MLFASESRRSHFKQQLNQLTLARLRLADVAGNSLLRHTVFVWGGDVFLFSFTVTGGQALLSERGLVSAG